MPDKPALVKCLVWDLDNTLWQGTFLEDPSVRLSSEIRDAITALDSRGILQSVASKNDYDLAWERLEDLGIAEYFVLPRIGWGRKSDSVIEVVGQNHLRLNIDNKCDGCFRSKPETVRDMGQHLAARRNPLLARLSTEA